MEEQLLYTEEELENALKTLYEIEMGLIIKGHNSNSDVKQDDNGKIKALRIGSYAISQIVWEKFYKSDFIAKYGTEYL